MGIVTSLRRSCLGLPAGGVSHLGATPAREHVLLTVASAAMARLVLATEGVLHAAHAAPVRGQDQCVGQVLLW